jgi:hypothetical protein
MQESKKKKKQVSIFRQRRYIFEKAFSSPVLIKFMHSEFTQMENDLFSRII